MRLKGKDIFCGAHEVPAATMEYGDWRELKGNRIEQARPKNIPSPGKLS
jgi:hypothetical protein